MEITSTKTLSFDQALELYNQNPVKLEDKAVAEYFFKGGDLQNGFVDNFPKAKEEPKMTAWEDFCTKPLLLYGIPRLISCRFTFCHSVFIRNWYSIAQCSCGSLQLLCLANGRDRICLHLHCLPWLFHGYFATGCFDLFKLCHGGK